MENKEVTLGDFINIVEGKETSSVSVPVPLVSVEKKPTPKKKTPLIVVKKDPTNEDIAKWISTKPGFVEALTETNFAPTKLYQYQIDYLSDIEPYKHIDKARQTGYSYVFACEAVAEAHLAKDFCEIFISINQEEANNKIKYARELYESMPLEFQKKLVVENKKCLEFEASSGKGRRTRIISHAQREPRGAGGNTRVILDECAHYMFGQQIYDAAMPITSRGRGGMTLASTPLGKTGIHWDVMSNPDYVDIYKFYKVFWWHCPEFVKDGSFEEAKTVCPNLSTVERVKEYGSMRLRHIFIGMSAGIETFKQEYECHHIDESVSYFPMNLINGCVYKITTDSIFDEPDKNATDDVMKYPVETLHPKEKFFFCTTIEDFLHEVANGRISGRLIGGFDVGRKHNTAELILIEEVKDNLYIVRLRRSFSNETFRTMKGELTYVLENANIRKLGIDATGPGTQLGEEMRQRFPGICEDVTFTSSWKEESSSKLRILMENSWFAIPDERDFKKQFHAIKRKVSESGVLKIEVEQNKEHHGDIFWACVLGAMYINNRPRNSFKVRRFDDGVNANPSRIVRPTKRVFGNKVPMVSNVHNTGRFGLNFPNFGKKNYDKR